LLVANKSIELTKEILDGDLSDEDREIYEMLLRLLEKNGRKICKRPVMVSNYGGTAGGRADMLYDMFRDLKIDRKYITKANAIKFAKIIGDSIMGVLNGGKAFEKYIQTMNNLIAKGGTPVRWSTGDGFLVIHVKNKELKPKQVKLTLPKSRRPTLIIKKIFSKEVSPSKMRSAISPNYIHSLDAELLRRVALRMRDEGIKNSDWIHDSFGCLPNEVSRMLEITKEVFLEMMEKDPLLVLDNDLRRQATRNGSTEKQLSKVSLPNLGDVNFSSILESEWFFS
jgi:DNA-directed RNA polymerase